MNIKKFLYIIALCLSVAPGFAAEAEKEHIDKAGMLAILENGGIVDGVTINGGDLKLVVNGETVNEVTGCDVVAGKIGLQSEGAEIHFRTVELIPLK